jgi:Flp pilus assembly protein TadG
MKSNQVAWRRRRLARAVPSARPAGAGQAVGEAASRVAKMRSLGQSVVEFAVILPLFMLLLLIAVDFGRAFFSYVALNNAAREAAAYGASGNDDYGYSRATDTTGMLSAAQHEANVQTQTGQGALNMNVTCRDSAGAEITCASTSDMGGGAGTGNTITVSLTQRFTFLTPIIGDIFGGGITMNSSSTATITQLAAGGDDSPDCSVAPSAAWTIASQDDLTVKLDPSGSAPTSGTCAVEYIWTFGDGDGVLGTSAPITHTYQHPGTYTVTLTVGNPAGIDSASGPVTVPAPAPPSVDPSSSQSPTPTPTPTATPTREITPPPDPTSTPVCTLRVSFTWQATSNKTVNFQGSYTGSPDVETWYWNFGDGNVLSGPAPAFQNVTHTYGNSGWETVTLTASGHFTSGLLCGADYVDYGVNPQ